MAKSITPSGRRNYFGKMITSYPVTELQRLPPERIAAKVPFASASSLVRHQQQVVHLAGYDQTALWATAVAMLVAAIP